MNFAFGRLLCVGVLLACVSAPVFAQRAAGPAADGQPQHAVRVTGVVRDHANAVVLPGVPVEVVGLSGLLHLPEIADLVAVAAVQSHAGATDSSRSGQERPSPRRCPIV